MKAPRAVLATSVLLVLTACSGGNGPDAGPTAPVSASVDPCVLAQDATAPPPDSCVTIQPTAPTGTDPADGSAHYKAVTIPTVPGQLAAVGNDKDVSKTSAELTVTVKKGNRLGVLAVCEGRRSVDVKTVPDSGAATTFTCGFNGFPAQFGVADSTLVKADTVYKISVSVPAPSRWYAAFYQNADLG